MEPYAYALTHAPTILDAATYRVGAVASSEAVDGEDEIIRAKGWKLNRVTHRQVKLLNAHNARNIADILGTVEIAVVNGRVLNVELTYAVKENPLAEFAWKMTLGQHLNGYSVGAKPLAVAALSDIKGYDGGTRWKANRKLWDVVVNEMGLDPKWAAENVRRITVAAELAELSALGVPSNPEAMVKGLQSGALREADFASIGLAGDDDFSLIQKGAQSWGGMTPEQRDNFSGFLCGLSRHHLQTKAHGTGATDQPQRERVEPEASQRAALLETCKTLAARFAAATRA